MFNRVFYYALTRQKGRLSLFKNFSANAKPARLTVAIDAIGE